MKYSIKEFLKWLGRLVAPGPYVGHYPAVPEGWRPLRHGEATQSGDKVWGFDGWYAIPLVNYSVKPGDQFIRALPHVALDDEFRNTQGKCSGRIGRTDDWDDSPYDSLL